MGGPPKAMKSASLDAVNEKSRQAREDDPDAAKIFWDMVLARPGAARYGHATRAGPVLRRRADIF